MHPTLVGAESWFDVEVAFSIEAEGALNPDADTLIKIGPGDAEAGLEKKLTENKFFTWEPGGFFSPPLQSDYQVQLIGRIIDQLSE